MQYFNSLCHAFSFFRFVFMALMEYCLVNIILGDSDQPKTVNNPPKAEKVFDLAAKVSYLFRQPLKFFFLAYDLYVIQYWKLYTFTFH